MILALLWALVCVGAGILIAIVTLILRGERLAKAVQMHLNGLSDTHALGFESLTLSIARVEARVKAVEEEVMQ